MRQVRDVGFCADGNVDEEQLGRELEVEMTPEGRLERHIKDALPWRIYGLGDLVSWCACFFCQKSKNGENNR